MECCRWNPILPPTNQVPCPLYFVLVCQGNLFNWLNLSILPNLQNMSPLKRCLETWISSIFLQPCLTWYFPFGNFTNMKCTFYDIWILIRTHLHGIEIWKAWIVTLRLWKVHFSYLLPIKMFLLKQNLMLTKNQEGSLCQSYDFSEYLKEFLPGTVR